MYWLLTFALPNIMSRLHHHKMAPKIFETSRTRLVFSFSLQFKNQKQKSQVFGHYPELGSLLFLFLFVQLKFLFLFGPVKLD